MYFQVMFIGHSMLSGLVETREIMIVVVERERKTDEHISVEK